jgi:MFS family permease
MSARTASAFQRISLHAAECHNSCSASQLDTYLHPDLCRRSRRQGRLSAPAWAGWAGLITAVCGTFGFVSLGFLADGIGRKPTVMLWYAMCLVLTPIVYLWGANWGLYPLLVLVGVFGFFTLGIWAWAPVWLPELFPTRMRGTAVAFCFNAPRFISCLGPLIAGTLIAYFGGFGMAATIVGLFFILGVVAAPFLPETRGKPLPHALWLETPAASPGPAN